MAEQGTDTVTKCANCGATLQGEYCHVCGQRGKDPRRLVIGLVQDVIVETLSIDSKLARTVWTLFRAPGRLAKAYISGQRVRYSPPFRLYLFTSVLFFAVLFWMLTAELGLNGPPDAPSNPPAAESNEAPPTDEAQPDTAPEDDPAEEPGESDLGDLNLNLGVGEGTDWGDEIEARLESAWRRLQDDPRLFVAQTRDNMPRVLLLAPLVYALQLVILYIYRRKFLLYDHLIVSLYMHAALYAYLLGLLLVSMIPIFGGLLAFLLAIWGVLQPYAVLRQAYGSNWVSVVLKGTAIHIGYFVMFVILVTAGLGVALYNS
ncbi:MAG: DUF3667 domain-containing protein [Pseudomonadota bacterium]